MSVYDEASQAWDMYRRFQAVRWPATGGRDLIQAQSRLWHLTEPYASGRDTTVDLPAVRAAAEAFAATVRRHCGDTAGDYVAGTITEGERAA